jgi:hypothetical protein
VEVGPVIVCLVLELAFKLLPARNMPIPTIKIRAMATSAEVPSEIALLPIVNAQRIIENASVLLETMP